MGQLKNCLIRICYIEKKGDKIILYNCEEVEVFCIDNKNSKKIYIHNGEKKGFSINVRNLRYFTTIFHDYRNYIKDKLDYDLPAIWILVGKKSNEEVVLQVGRNRDTKNMSNNDIAVDSKDTLEQEEGSIQHWDMMNLHFIKWILMNI